MPSKYTLLSTKFATHPLLSKTDRCPSFCKSTRTWCKHLLGRSEMVKKDKIKKRGDSQRQESLERLSGNLGFGLFFFSEC